MCACVCVSACLSARICPEPHARFLPFFAHVALLILWMTSCFYNGPYSGMNFATMDRFRSNLHIYHKVGHIQFPIIKGRNFD